MADKAENPFKFWEELKRRKVIRVIIGFFSSYKEIGQSQETIEGLLSMLYSDEGFITEAEDHARKASQWNLLNGFNLAQILIGVNKNNEEGIDKNQMYFH